MFPLLSVLLYRLQKLQISGMRGPRISGWDIRNGFWPFLLAELICAVCVTISPLFYLICDSTNGMTRGVRYFTVLTSGRAVRAAEGRKVFRRRRSDVPLATGDACLDCFQGPKLRLEEWGLMLWCFGVLGKSLQSLLFPTTWISGKSSSWDATSTLPVGLRQGDIKPDRLLPLMDVPCVGTTQLCVSRRRANGQRF
jgi:hypothetical protein